MFLKNSFKMNLEENNVSKKSSGRFYEEDNRKDFQIYSENGRIIADLIYTRAVELHENKEQYNIEVKNSLLQKIIQKVPEVADYTALYDHFARTIDRVCEKKENISETIYNQNLNRIKQAKMEENKN